MKKPFRFFNISCLLLSFLLLISWRPPGYAGDTIPPPYLLLQALITTGTTRHDVKKYLFSAPLSVSLPIILKNILHREKKEDYRAFLEREQIKKSRRFLQEHRAVLSKIEKTYGVPKEILVAILLVESDLGGHRDRYSVLKVYLSLASLIDPVIRAKVSRAAARAGANPYTPAFRHRINRKAAWGLRELACLLRMGQQGYVDITKLKGSWAGAFGMPQFIPTSFESYGVDWDKDGKICLDLLPDAAASAANYLRSQGWRGKMNRQKALTVIKRYNHSQPYAETILTISEKLGNH